MSACIRGCTRRIPDAEPVPVQTDGNSQLCRPCTDRVADWLDAIPDTYALLLFVAHHGAVDRNPDSQTTKRSVAPPPMRLEVSDLLDQRRGRRWNGTMASHQDYRGVLGTLESWARMVREERCATPPKGRPTVAGEAGALRRHLPWIVQHRWVAELYDDLHDLHRDLTEAVGDYRARPVGTCIVARSGALCGGPLLPSDGGGAHCPRCGDTWNIGQLRRLAAPLLRQGA